MTYNLDLNIQKILQDWSISDALRELIANAYDEAKLTNTQQPIITYDEKLKRVIIKDFGRGLKQEHFTQNESKEKNNSSIVVGKFGIGLKDAISVLFRFQKPIIFKSSYNTFWPNEKLKQGTKDNIKTLHMEYNNETIDVGTEIIIDEIKKIDYDEAIQNFLENSKLEKIASSLKGEIYKNKGVSCIYYNGMKISTDEDFMFSYNILEANAKLKKSLNRERKMISRDAFREIIISILKSCVNKENQYLINLIIEKREDNSSNEWSFKDVKKLVAKYSNEDIIFASNEDMENPAYLEYAKQENRKIIFVNSGDYRSIYNDESTKNHSLDYFGHNFVNNYKSEIVIEKDLQWYELSNWKWAINKIYELSKIWPEWNKHYKTIVINIIKYHPNACGISTSGKIEILKSQLIDKAKLFNTLIHEICHIVSNCSDATLGFENTLTSAFYYVLKIKE